jgi:hypothetical protein
MKLNVIYGKSVNQGTLNGDSVLNVVKIVTNGSKVICRSDVDI